MSMCRAFLWAALCLAPFFFLEAAGASLRARRGDDDGDGDGGGLGGALAGMMGGGGGGDDGGSNDDDDDPNMVGTHKKKKSGSGGAKSSSGIDLNGLEGALSSGGVGQLTQMLKLMRAAHSPVDSHIKKGENGEEMYDFRDLDDGISTTPMPVISVTEKPDIKIAAAPMVEIPDMPKISLPGKGGMIKGLKEAEQAAKVNKKRLQEDAADAARQKAAGKLVSWPPPQPAAVQQPPVVQQAQVAPVVAAMPMQQAAPMAPLMSAVPMQQAMAPGMMAPAQSTNGLYQGLAAMKQSMEMLMGQVAGLQGRAPSAPAAEANVAPLNARLDQLSQSFTSEEHKMEQRVEAVESQNKEMKKELDDEAAELKALKQEVEDKKEASEKKPVAVVKQEAENKPAAVQAVSGDVKKAPAEKPTVVKASAEKPAVKTPAVHTPVVQKVAVQKGSVKKATQKKASKGHRKKAAAKKAAVAAVGTTYETKPWDATFTVHLDGKASGKKDTFTIRVHPEWAPEGAKRFQDIIRSGILKDARFFRVVPGFMVQFGIPGKPKVAAEWEHKRIQDDAVKQSNTRGMVTFATSGPNTRTTQMFINYANNDFLDKQGFSPFAEVIDDGMDVVERIQSKYREKPNQGKIQHHGNKYLMKHFPQLSFVDHIEGKFSSPPPQAAGFIQDSESPEMAKDFPKKAYRYQGIATFYHQKVKAAE